MKIEKMILETFIGFHDWNIELIRLISSTRKNPKHEITIRWLAIWLIKILTIFQHISLHHRFSEDLFYIIMGQQ